MASNIYLSPASPLKTYIKGVSRHRATYPFFNASPFTTTQPIFRSEMSRLCLAATALLALLAGIGTCRPHEERMVTITHVVPATVYLTTTVWVKPEPEHTTIKTVDGGQTTTMIITLDIPEPTARDTTTTGQATGTTTGTGNESPTNVPSLKTPDTVLPLSNMLYFTNWYV